MKKLKGCSELPLGSEGEDLKLRFWGVRGGMGAVMVILSFIFLVVTLVLLLLYMAVCDARKIGEVFRESRVISSYYEIWGGGSIAGRCTVLMIATGTVLWPRIHIARGDLLPAELELLPRTILMRMRCAAGLTIISFSLIGGLLIYGKFIK
ncbi:hypothetical protein [Pseudomonas sp.]|uniref:hypothetical protein n=1 Tax=Pseudomonas sp. TaxID=306 RepID=UPI0025E46B2D|nr:hypothetical protein [Pseudomonas sp.]